MASEERISKEQLLSRRRFLATTSLALIGLFALSTPLRTKLTGALPPVSGMRFPGAGSIFQPRADQRLRVWARWHNLFRR